MSTSPPSPALHHTLLPIAPLSCPLPADCFTRSLTTTDTSPTTPATPQPAVAALLKAAHMAHLSGPAELRSQPSDSAQEESGDGTGDGEESSWALGRLEALQGMGPEGLAAVNLLSMSYSGDVSPLPSPTRLRLRCLDQQQPAAHVPALKLEPAEVKVEPPPLSITPPPTAPQAQPRPPSPPPAAIATTTNNTTGPACHATITTTSPGPRAASPAHGQPAAAAEAAAATTAAAAATATAAVAATTAPATTAATAAAADALRSFFDQGMCSALEQAPTHKLMRLMELRDQVEAAQREAAAADAAVSSVARVLAMKQAAAIKAKTAAAAAARQLQCMLVDWDREAAAGQVLPAKKIRLFH